MARHALAFGAGVALPLLLAQSGLFVELGAHPRWAVQVALIGAPIGAAIALLPWLQGRRLLAGLVILGLAMAAASYGKTQFAASFAEDVLAGRLWYFGWIGIALGDAMVVAALMLFVFPAKED